MVMLTGSVADPVSAEAIIWPPAPTFTVATTNAPVPFAPEMFTIPGSALAAKATNIRHRARRGGQEEGADSGDHGGPSAIRTAEIQGYVGWRKCGSRGE